MFNELQKQNRVQDVVNVKDTYLAIKNGTANALVSLNTIIPYWLSELNLKKELKVVATNDFEENIPHGLVLSKQDFTKEQVEKIKKVVHEMTIDGTLYKIYNKYLDKDIVNTMLLPH